MFGHSSFAEHLRGHLTDVQTKIDRLDSIRLRLSLYQEVFAEPSNLEGEPAPRLSHKVFVVHGRDEASKQATARLLTLLGLEPIIPDEQPNQGRTIIEKLQDYSRLSYYAVVLLTPDDVGALASEKDSLGPRARQNVVFELGYFSGALGRKAVCALCTPEVERPSDIDGVLYIPLDMEGAWRFKLAKELKAFGFDIDFNRLLEC